MILSISQMIAILSLSALKRSFLFIKIEKMPEVILNNFQDFEMANKPVSFFIYTFIDQKANVEDISFENVKTNEKLVFKTKSGANWKTLMISRYPLNAAESWIEANEKEITGWNRRKLNRKINMVGELTIAI
jgi:hypothetical protein